MGHHILHTDINSFDLDPKTSNRRLLFGYLISLRKKPNIHCLILFHCYKPTQTYAKSITILLHNCQNQTQINIKFDKKQMGNHEISQNYQV